MTPKPSGNATKPTPTPTPTLSASIEEIKVEVGKNYTCKVIVMLGKTKIDSDYTVSNWTTGKSEIATVSDGNVTGVSAGNTTVSCTVEYDGQKCTARGNVIVSAQEVTFVFKGVSNYNGGKETVVRDYGKITGNVGQPYLSVKPPEIVKKFTTADGVTYVTDADSWGFPTDGYIGANCETEYTIEYTLMKNTEQNTETNKREYQPCIPVTVTAVILYKQRRIATR